MLPGKQIRTIVPSVRMLMYKCTQMTGLPWAKYIVAAAALMGILTGPLIGFYAGARIIYVLGRERLLPPVFSQMSTRFGTPVVATAVQGVVVGEHLQPLNPSSSCCCLKQFAEVIIFVCW